MPFFSGIVVFPLVDWLIAKGTQSSRCGKSWVTNKGGLLHALFAVGAALPPNVLLITLFRSRQSL
jgi:hypothetical protein